MRVFATAGFLALGLAFGAADAASAPAAATTQSPANPPGAARDRGAGQGAKAAADEPEAAPPRPAHDPALVEKAIDLSAEEPADGRRRLGIRLAVVARSPDEPWLLAVVNRGTEPARVLFDLRLLSLEVQPPAEDSAPPRRPRIPKPILCQLPANVRPDAPEPAFEVRLEPGEGLVDAFDPRLYCFSASNRSPLARGGRVAVRLGYPEKTRSVWRQGKRETQVLEQTAPFVARRATPLPDLEQIREEAPVDTGPGAPGSDADAIKQLVAQPIELPPASPEPAPPPSTPLELVTLEGSDARNARAVTAAVAIVNRSAEPSYVYFRRELVSFEVSGPGGAFTCEPGPDERAPDRQSYSRLKPGGRVTATSRLIELCPDGSFEQPGLYLVETRLEATRSGAEFGLDAFRGRLESDEPVPVRVQEGATPFAPHHAPARIQVGRP